VRQNLSTVRLAVMFSVTAPGADVYPFDPSACRQGPAVSRFGRIGRRVSLDIAAAFNQRAGKLWRELNRVAKVRADRSSGYRGKLAVRVCARAGCGRLGKVWPRLRIGPVLSLLGSFSSRLDGRRLFVRRRVAWRGGAVAARGVGGETRSVLRMRSPPTSTPAGAAR